ncbi:hypothetical protein D3C78_1654290 [compost metagenome]
MLFGIYLDANAIWDVPEKANPTPIMILKIINKDIFVVTVNPNNPIPITKLLHFKIATLLSLSAIIPLKGLQHKDVRA